MPLASCPLCRRKWMPCARSWCSAPCSEHHAHFDPHVITLHALLDVQFRQPFDFCRQIDFAKLVRIRDDRSNANCAALKAAQRRAGAAVAADLLVIKGVRTYPGEAAEQRQMLRHGAVEVEYLSALVIGGV